MSDSYAKVFRTMYTGSLYGAGMHVFAVWGWILAHKDAEGSVEVNPRMVAGELGGTVDQVRDAVEYLMKPDPESRSKEHDGCRLVQGGQFEYTVVNHAKYREKGKDRAAYWREYRARTKAEEASCATVRNSGAQPSAHHTDADADTDADSQVTSDNREPSESNKSKVDSKTHFDLTLRDFPDATRLDYRQKLRDVLHIGSSTSVKSTKSANKGLDSFERWLHTNVVSGRFGPDAYTVAMEIAEDCVKSETPYAAFMSRIQEEMRYVPPTKKQHRDGKAK